MADLHIPYIKRAISRVKAGSSHPLIPAAKRLRKWLITTQTTVPQLAIQTGFSASTLYDYISGRPNTYPSLAQAFAIEYTTNGAVPAWMWLDNPYIQAKVRNHQLAGAQRFERSIKSFVLKFNTLKTDEGMIRHKARMLSRLFGVEWGEVKRRCWEDAKQRSKSDRKDISYLLQPDGTDEED